MAILVVEFSKGIQNKKDFWLKIEIINVENWSSGELSKIGHPFRK